MFQRNHVFLPLSPNMWNILNSKLPKFIFCLRYFPGQKTAKKTFDYDVKLQLVYHTRLGNSAQFFLSATQEISFFPLIFTLFLDVSDWKAEPSWNRTQNYRFTNGRSKSKLLANSQQSMHTSDKVFFKCVFSIECLEKS